METSHLQNAIDWLKRTGRSTIREGYASLDDMRAELARREPTTPSVLPSAPATSSIVAGRFAELDIPMEEPKRSIAQRIANASTFKAPKSPGEKP
jgi:hypothetical protein